ncbi:MAG: M14 family zinc carboxypeptidase [Blautia faecis]
MLSESVLSVRKELFPQNKTAVSDMPKVNIQKKVQPTDADMVQTSLSFENIYYSLWEIAGRYSSFCQFRVIGNSHDERMIPMLEVGTGAQMIFCVAGINGTQALLPELLLKMAGEYCRAYECGWKLDEFYEVKKLLDKIRICLIPILNPDGYEIRQNGFGAIRNPVYRQMLRMQSIPAEDFGYNARGMDISHNFPTVHYIRSRMGEEPASENETKALIRIIQEYDGRGLLTFAQSGREIIYYHCQQGVGSLPKSYRLARHMQKSSSYHLEREQMTESARRNLREWEPRNNTIFKRKNSRHFVLKYQLKAEMEEALKRIKRQYMRKYICFHWNIYFH